MKGLLDVDKHDFLLFVFPFVFSFCFFWFTLLRNVCLFKKGKTLMKNLLGYACRFPREEYRHCNAGTEEIPHLVRNTSLISG